jgi:hypothetical protein
MYPIPPFIYGKASIYGTEERVLSDLIGIDVKIELPKKVFTQPL